MKKRILTVLLAVCLVFALGTVSALAADTTVTTLDGLRDAITSAEPEDTITLGADIEVPETIKISDKDITINLAGHTLISTSKQVAGEDTIENYGMGRIFYLTNGTSLTIDGTVPGSGMRVAEDAITAGLIVLDMGCNLTVNSGSYNGDTSIFYMYDGDPDVKATKCEGGLFQVLDFSDSELTSEVALNNLTVDTNYMVFETLCTVNETNWLALDVEGGNYTGADDKLFHIDTLPVCPATFNGVTATVNGGYPVVELDGSAGTFDNCNFAVTGTNVNEYSDSPIFVGYVGSATINSGTYTSVGAGVYIGTSGGVINIVGGTISGERYAVKADVDIETYGDVNSTINIMGGDISGALATDDSPNADIVVTGGNFSEPVDSDYLSDSLAAELYSVSNSDTPYSYYLSIEAALSAAQTGDEITYIGSEAEQGYEVKFDYGSGDVVTINVPSEYEFALPAPTRSGYELRGWRDGDGKLYKANAEYIVKGDVTFTAVWDAIDIPDTYPINVADAANGEVSTSLTNASRGSVITITATPDAGYSVGSVSVTGPDGRVDVKRVNATTYTFVMPEGEVTVRVTFTTGLPFTDVSANQWFYEAVSYVYANGMMEGDSAATFNPDGQMTRAMFWAVLGRIDGANITGSNWAAEAREWAMSEGVSDGTDPNGLVTREMMVTMLWRYAGEPASEYGLSAYSDAASVSDWAETAMAWAVENGVISGVTANTLVPQGTATRAQCATIFMRYDAEIA